MFSPAMMVFISMSLFGTFVVFMSGGLLGMWLGLELGLFGFLPILNGKTVGENEAAVKYFIVQAVGSGIMLVSFLFISGDVVMVLGNWNVVNLIGVMMMGGFMTKLGVFPLHFWFPSVMSASSWFSCFWLSVVQKVGPFWGVSGLGLDLWLLNTLILSLVITSLVGAFGGLAQVHFRPLLAYSSLGQTGWMGLVCLLRVELFMLYMLVYTFILSGLLCGLYLAKSYSLTDVPGWDSGKGLLFWIFSGGFFISLSGLPPLAGSFLKLVGILVIIGKYPIFLGALIGSSMVSLYYYLSVFINSIVCLGSSSYSGVLSLVESGSVFPVVCGVVILNWVGGLPLFLVCGMISL